MEEAEGEARGPSSRNTEKPRSYRPSNDDKTSIITMDTLNHCLPFTGTVNGEFSGPFLEKLIRKNIPQNLARNNLMARIFR